MRGTRWGLSLRGIRDTPRVPDLDLRLLQLDLPEHRHRHRCLQRVPTFAQSGGEFLFALDGPAAVVDELHGRLPAELKLLREVPGDPHQGGGGLCGHGEQAAIHLHLHVSLTAASGSALPWRGRSQRRASSYRKLIETRVSTRPESRLWRTWRDLRVGRYRRNSGQAGPKLHPDGCVKRAVEAGVAKMGPPFGTSRGIAKMGPPSSSPLDGRCCCRSIHRRRQTQI